ncbi:MAG: glycosyltransferase family 39 protein [Gallionellaceae bacterium]|nr:glycosyltransferase family 39 protein [Gallionellaceae bacterium]
MISRLWQRDPLLWAFWLTLLAIAAFASRSYIPIDETRYLSVAWEMWLRGDFLVPFKNGEPYSHKPPLLFWLMHAGWLITGVNEWWPRLISPLLTLATLFMVRRIATLLWPNLPQVARLSPWILLSSFLWTLYSQGIMFDLLLAVWVVLGILALVLASRGQRLAWGLFAVALGLGVLAKGPAVLPHLLPPALLAPWWLGRGGGNWKQWYGRLFLAVLAGTALALLWAIPAGLSGGEAYRNAIFWGQTANRMVQSFAHNRPFWWYLPLLPLLLYPWLLWPTLWRRVAGINLEMDAGQRLMLAWMLPSFLAFSLVSGKQVHYLLPEFPAFALLAGRLLANDRNSSRPWLPALALAAVGILMLLLPYLKLPENSKALAQVPAWGGCAFLALSAWLALQRGTPERITARLATTSLMAMMLVYLLLIRPLSPAYDVRPISRVIAVLQTQGRPIANVGEYHAQFQFAGRLRQPLRELRQGQESSDWLKANPDGVVVLYFPMKTDLTAYHPLFTQAYRGETAALFNAGEALALLALSVQPE